MGEVTNAQLLQAIRDFSGEVRENSERLNRLDERLNILDKSVGSVDERVGSLEGKINNLETAMKEFKSEVKLDIRKLDRKFTLVLEDLHEARTDIHILQQSAEQ